MELTFLDQLKQRASSRSLYNWRQNFFQISCLKINLSKTTAIWFGEKHDCAIKLCGDLGIEWDTTFRLLGIDFHNNLENMENNFDVIVGKIEKVLNSWIYRHLTPFGKITVIKSLALSKLSHLAMVLPTLSKHRFKQIEKILYNFLCNKKPDKIARAVAVLPVKRGVYL